MEDAGQHESGEPRAQMATGVSTTTPPPLVNPDQPDPRAPSTAAPGTSPRVASPAAQGADVAVAAATTAQAVGIPIPSSNPPVGSAMENGGTNIASREAWPERPPRPNLDTPRSASPQVQLQTTAASTESVSHQQPISPTAQAAPDRSPARESSPIVKEEYLGPAVQGGQQQSLTANVQADTGHLQPANSATAEAPETAALSPSTQQVPGPLQQTSQLHQNTLPGPSGLPVRLPSPQRVPAPSFSPSSAPPPPHPLPAPGPAVPGHLHHSVPQRLPTQSGSQLGPHPSSQQYPPHSQHSRQLPPPPVHVSSSQPAPHLQTHGHLQHSPQYEHGYHHQQQQQQQQPQQPQQYHQQQHYQNQHPHHHHQHQHQHQPPPHHHHQPPPSSTAPTPVPGTPLTPIPPSQQHFPPNPAQQAWPHRQPQPQPEPSVRVQFVLEQRPPEQAHEYNNQAPPLVPNVRQQHHHHHHQQQQQQQQQTPTVAAVVASVPVHIASLSKPIIMDPPSVRKGGQQGGGQAGQPNETPVFPSPTMQNQAAPNPKFVDDYTRINFAIQQSIPEAVRRIVRDRWEKCLLGSEFHQAFVLNAAIHHASAAITQRAVRDFGGKLVDTARRDIVAHFSAEALDDVADLIISKASDKFLDKCLEKRLLTIGAKPLINALAAAERLGYEPSDMVQVEPNERVIPQAPPSQPAPTNPPQNHPVAQCLKCFRTFAYPSAHEYHATHDVCSQIPPDNKGFEHACIHCGKGFTNVVDLQRHTEQQVCTTPRPAQTPQPRLNQAGTVVTRSPSSVHTPGAATIELHLPSTIPSAKPTPPTAGTGLPGDPYGHLTPDQIQSMNEDLRAAEEQFAPRFAEANEIADSGQRRAKLEGLRNSFGTKQSLIRKKYGVRLRERRTKAEIEAERARVMGRQPRNGASRPPPTPGSGLALTAPVAPAAGSGWTAANTPRTTANWEEHDAKRRRLSEAGGHHSPSRTLADDTPTRKVSGSYPTAATSSSSASSRPTTTYEQSGARIQIHIPTANSQHQQQKPGGSAHPDGVSGTASRTATPDGSHSGTGADSENRQQQQQHGHGRTGLSSAPVVIDDDDDSSSGDDEDIPSTLPSHVRKSLGASGSPSVVQKTP